MAYPSKEDKVLELFFNEATKHWHFHDIVKTANVSDVVANKWLKKYCSQKLIKRIKPGGKMPYYVANWDNEEYHTAKRFYALNKLHESGLIHKLQSLKKAKTIVIFGSFARTDWHTESDVDIFIYGYPEEFRFGTMWEGLGMLGKSRELSVHSYPSLEKIRSIHSGLMRNVVKGFFVKGSVHDIAEVAA
ncbi:MAG: nucleotidyltransferase domain-containing protein [Candidatus Woesearchaeota archaeon]